MTTTTPSTARPSTAPADTRPARSSVDPATLAVGAAVGFATLVAGLHLLRSDLDPSWRMVSEYEIGRHGWVMRVAFGLLSIACLALHRALRGRVTGRAATVGRAGLVAAAIGTALAGLCAPDPITTEAADHTTQGTLHALGFFVGMPGLLVAVACVTAAIRRTAPGAAGPVRLARAAVAAGFGVFATAMAVTADSEPGPDDLVGWPNRLALATAVAWVVVAARTTRSQPRR
jgi:hypothetical protein